MHSLLKWMFLVDLAGSVCLTDSFTDLSPEFGASLKHTPLPGFDSECTSVPVFELCKLLMSSSIFIGWFPLLRNSYDLCSQQ